MKNSVDYLDGNNFIFHHNTAATSISVPEDPVVATAPPPPSSDFVSINFVILHIISCQLACLVFKDYVCFNLNYVDVLIF